jgi:hypothetical protein
MKKIAAVLALLLLLCTAGGVWAMGPVFMGAKTAVWDPVTEATGYYLYWGVSGQGIYEHYAHASINRIDLIVAGIPEGTWDMVVTAHDANQNESDFSNRITWSYKIVAEPANVKTE